MPLYLVWHEPERTIDPELRLALERFGLPAWIRHRRGIEPLSERSA